MMYLANESVDKIVKITGGFVGSFEILILPVLMFFVLNKRYKIVGKVVMTVMILVTVILTLGLFIAFF